MVRLVASMDRADGAVVRHLAILVLHLLKQVEGELGMVVHLRSVHGLGNLISVELRGVPIIREVIIGKMSIVYDSGMASTYRHFIYRKSINE